MFKPNRRQMPSNPNDHIDYTSVVVSDIYLAGGCFWGLEAYMKRIYGVISAHSGYANGLTENPSYEDLLYRQSGHAETVHVRYDANRIALKTLLKYYFKVIDPTTLNRQGNDFGTQYRTGIYYTSPEDLDIIQKALQEESSAYEVPLVVEVMPLKHFYVAEDYHQDYLDKNKGGYCHINLFEVESVIIEAEWFIKPEKNHLMQILSAEAYRITQENGTEKPFANAFWETSKKGIYVDITTGEPLFSSKDKFESHCGWPSFTKPIVPEVIIYKDDFSHGMQRIEVRSRVGDAHLGHVFNDGPIETGGLRFCINSAALRFIASDQLEEAGYGYLMVLFLE